MGFYAETVFPWMLDKMLDKPSIHERRARLTGPAAGDVLEIGFGTGQSLAFYDRAKVRSLSAVEPSSGMSVRARERMSALGWVVRIEPLAGENLPYGDDSFDCVISSLTLCSVADPPRVLAEIWRVLRPGGTFRFFEHVASEHPERRKWQDRFNPLQRIVAVGCNLNRDTVAAVRAVGFLLEPVQQQVELSFPFARYMPVVEAAATKPG